MPAQSTSRILARSISIGVLFSMVFFYCIHVFGTWKVENYRPDPDTTGSILLHNTCLVFGKVHTLRPNTDVSQMNDRIDGTKLGGSFMNFFDGHIPGMTILGLIIGGIIFLFWNKSNKASRAKTQQ